MDSTARRNGEHRKHSATRTQGGTAQAASPACAQPAVTITNTRAQPQPQEAPTHVGAAKKGQATPAQ